MLTLTRALLALRRGHPALSVGSWLPVSATGDLLAYLRQGDGESFLVALNLGGEPLSAAFADLSVRGAVRISTAGLREGEAVRGSIDLRPNEGVIVQLSG